jgi:hypothetical protein
VYVIRYLIRTFPRHWGWQKNLWISVALLRQRQHNTLVAARSFPPQSVCGKMNQYMHNYIIR